MFNDNFVSDIELIELDFKVDQQHTLEYENCIFNNCSFSNADLSNKKFIDCSFINCDFSTAKTLNTAFQNVVFEDCKLLGLRFDDCNKFLLSFQFQNCQLNYASFYKLSIKQTLFNNCQLVEADFVETNLTQSTFSNCDLSGAIFENTKLEQVDFRTSWNFTIDPNLNKIQKAKFSTQNISGLLSKYDIHIE